MSNKTVEEYLALPYTIELIRETYPENTGWAARVVELPGCITQADTFEELGEMIDDAMRGWIEVSLEDGDPIPEPRLLDEYSGKFVARVPRSLHRDLVQSAERNGVSLNAFVNMALAQATGEQLTIKKETPLVYQMPSEQVSRYILNDKKMISDG